MSLKKLLLWGSILAVLGFFFLFVKIWLESLTYTNSILTHFIKKPGFEISVSQIGFSWDGRVILSDLKIIYLHKPAVIIKKAEASFSIVPLIFKRKFILKQLKMTHPSGFLNVRLLKFLLKRVKKHTSENRTFTAVFSSGTLIFRLPNKKKVILTHIHGSIKIHHKKKFVHFRGTASSIPLHYLARKFIFPLGAFIRGNLHGSFSVKGKFQHLHHSFNHLTLHFTGKTRDLSFQDIPLPDSTLTLRKSTHPSLLKAFLETNQFKLNQIEVIHQFIPLDGEGNLKISLTKQPSKKLTASFYFPKIKLYHKPLGLLKGKIVYLKKEFHLLHLRVPIPGSSLKFQGEVDIARKQIFLSSHLNGEKISNFAVFLPGVKNQITGNLYGSLILKGGSHQDFMSFSGSVKNFAALGKNWGTIHLKGRTFPAETRYPIHLKTKVAGIPEPFVWTGSYGILTKSLSLSSYLNRIPIQKLISLTTLSKIKMGGKISGIFSFTCSPTASTLRFKGKITNLQYHGIILGNGKITFHGTPKNIRGKFILRTPISLGQIAKITGAAVRGSFSNPEISLQFAP